MNIVALKTDLSCQHCVNKVEPILKNNPEVAEYKIDLSHPARLVTITSNEADIDAIIADFNKVGYKAEKY